MYSALKERVVTTIMLAHRAKFFPTLRGRKAAFATSRLPQQGQSQANHAEEPRSVSSKVQ
jgi:hypothetical protein